MVSLIPLWLFPTTKPPSHLGKTVKSCYFWVWSLPSQCNCRRFFYSVLPAAKNNNKSNIDVCKWSHDLGLFKTQLGTKLQLTWCSTGDSPALSSSFDLNDLQKCIPANTSVKLWNVYKSSTFRAYPVSIWIAFVTWIWFCNWTKNSVFNEVGAIPSVCPRLGWHTPLHIMLL